MLKDANFLKTVLVTIKELSNETGPKLNREKKECLLTGSFIDVYSDRSFIHRVKITMQKHALNPWVFT